MAALLAVLRGSGPPRPKSKHKKLLEEGASEPVAEGVTFYVKYLGSSLVDQPTGEEATSSAIKTISTMVKKQDRKLDRVALTISLRGIKMETVATGAAGLDFSIYRISYCSTDTTHNNVFAFIATNKNETLECHAFAAQHRKMAQAATLTIAQAFNLAFKNWQAEQEKKGELVDKEEVKEDKENKESKEEEHNIKDEGGLSVSYNKEEERSLIHLGAGGDRGQLVVERRGRGGEGGGGGRGPGDHDLLIDLALPVITVVDTNPATYHPLMDREEEEEDMMMSFTQLARRRSPPPILRGLPPDAARSRLDAFASPPLQGPALWRVG